MNRTQLLTLRTSAVIDGGGRARAAFRKGAQGLKADCLGEPLARRLERTPGYHVLRDQQRLAEKWCRSMPCAFAARQAHAGE